LGGRRRRPDGVRGAGYGPEEVRKLAESAAKAAASQHITVSSEQLAATARQLEEMVARFSL
jgi:hypothetical protein